MQVANLIVASVLANLYKNSSPKPSGHQCTDMKTSVFVVFVAVYGVASQAALTDEQKSKIIEYYKQCTDSTGVDRDLVNRARNGDFDEDAKLKEFYGCMFQKAGIQNEDGEILVDAIKEKVPDDFDQDEAARVIEICKDKKGETPAETAFLVYKCYWDNTKQHITLA
nr:odorant-binding protein [Lasioderma serricorne]